MPWKVRDAMSERLDLVTFAGQMRAGQPGATWPGPAGGSGSVGRRATNG